MIKIAATRGDGTVYTRAYIEVGVIDVSKAGELADAAVAEAEASGGWDNVSDESKI